MYALWIGVGRVTDALHNYMPEGDTTYSTSEIMHSYLDCSDLARAGQCKEVGLDLVVDRAEGVVNVAQGNPAAAILGLGCADTCSDSIAVVLNELQHSTSLKITFFVKS